MDVLRLLEDLKKEKEIVPDEYDGSYELLRETVKEYAALGDYSSVTDKDLAVIYMMIAGTWKFNIEKKKDCVNVSCLPAASKEALCNLLDDVWEKVCTRQYTNCLLGNRPAFGIFRAESRMVQNNAEPEQTQQFIEMLVALSKVSDDDEMFAIVSKFLSVDFTYMGMDTFSFILHSLCPYSFPIMGFTHFKQMYDALNVPVQSPLNIENFISNVRVIKDFRDRNLSFKNYFVIYNMSQNLKEYEDEYIPSLTEYDPGITKEKYLELLRTDGFINLENLDTVYYMYKLGGEASCKQIEQSFGKTAKRYNANGRYFAQRIQAATNCPVTQRENGNDRYWAVTFLGRNARPREAGDFVWKLRDPLLDAVKILADEGYFKELDMVKDIGINKNTILYGPPGTGKTYSTVIYAVAIVENKPLEEVSAEAANDYDGVFARYKKYLDEDHRIAFTTFHQSYSYEDFIEGIKPDLNDDENADISYKITSGVFKEFCENAVNISLKEVHDYGFNTSPTIWKVSLKGTGSNDIRDDCMRNSYIRVDYENSDEAYDNGHGRRVINAFYNRMQIGDIVFSCYSNSNIDAIGVVVGEPEKMEKFSEYKNIRKVKWLITGKNYNITKLNSGKSMTTAAIHKLDISVSAAVKLIAELSEPDETPKQFEENDEKNNYVFIIDEINRGNISKIFGELLTLIEPNKRLSAEEEMTAVLPYSKKPFGVPGNIYILGTMNTADRSIAMMDTALRRRFEFVEMQPKPEILRGMTIEGIDIEQLLSVMNKRIKALYDREHTIGHAYFTPLKAAPSMENLAKIFKKKIIPLLQEYFYDDYEKIQKVLGDDKKSGRPNLQFIQEDDDFGGLDMEEGFIQYKINEDAFTDPEAYIGIYDV